MLYFIDAGEIVSRNYMWISQVSDLMYTALIHWYQCVRIVYLIRTGLAHMVTDHSHDC